MCILIYIGSIDEKLLSCLVDLVVKGVGGLSESVKRRKFLTKIFFSDNVE